MAQEGGAVKRGETTRFSARRVWRPPAPARRAGGLRLNCRGSSPAPEDLPTSDGAAVGAEAYGKLTDSARCRSVPHGTDEDDDGVQVDLWAEEADGGTRHSLPATVTIGAEAQPEALRLGKLNGGASGLAGVVSAVEAGTARICVGTGPSPPDLCRLQKGTTRIWQCEANRDT
jgi:hypothetical protein